MNKKEEKLYEDVKRLDQIADSLKHAVRSNQAIMISVVIGDRSKTSKNKMNVEEIIGITGELTTNETFELFNKFMENTTTMIDALDKEIPGFRQHLMLSQFEDLLKMSEKYSSGTKDLFDCEKCAKGNCPKHLSG